MATSNYNGLRVPLIALDYNSRFLAEKKEILFDYKTGKLYVVSAEDKSIIFDITQIIMKEVESGVDLTNYTFNIEGVGKVNLSKYIQQLSRYNLQTLDEPNKTYRVPQISFDNDSLTDFDGSIEIAGFNHALNNTYPVKDEGIIKWVPRTDTDIVARVRRLEETAPPDAAKFKQLQDDVAAVKFTADQYSNLPAIRRDLDNVTEKANDNASKITDLTPKITALEVALPPISTKLNDLELKSIELDAREDYGTRVLDLENKVNTLESKEDYGTKILTLQQKVANLEQAEDYSAAINGLRQRITTIADGIENTNNNITQEISQLKAYDNTNTQSITSIRSRIDALEAIGISTALDSLKSRTTALEGIPNLTTNVTNLEATTNTLTNGFSTLNAKVQTLLAAEDPIPRIKSLEDTNTAKANLRQESQVNLAGGTTVEVRPGVVYNFILDTAEPSFEIERSSNSTQEIILILDPHNLDGEAFNIHITRHDGIELKLPKRIIPTKNNEPQLIRLNSYDSGINWFCTVSPSFVGKDALIDDDTTTTSETNGAVSP